MRLHSLRLRALGPFADEQTVDFDKLGAGGLFLLDGPTGAGKSTVLDAITFALYGPGDRAEADRMHSHFAPVGAVPQATLEFSVAGVRHRVSRTPEYLRPKRRGGGVTRQAATVHLERLESNAWVSRTSNKAEAGELLGETIGLSRDQFTQVVLLPQGEFARFLRAGDDERRTLLTRLFGTRFYDGITAELDRLRAEAQADASRTRQGVDAALAAAAEAAGLDAGARAELLADGDPAARLDELGAALEARHRDATAEVAARVAELDAARRASDNALAYADALMRLVQLRAEHDAHEQTRAAHDVAVTTLAAALRAEPVRPLLDAVDETASDLAAARRGLAAGGADADDIGDVAGFATRAADEAVRAEQDAAELQHLLKREAGLAELAARVEAAWGTVEAVRAQREGLERRLTQLPGRIAKIEAELQTAEAAARELPVVCQQHEAIRGRLVAVRQLTELGPAVENARRDRGARVSEHQQAVDDDQQLTDRRLAGVAAELAAELRDGEPCTVCGALEHPRPAAAAAASVSAAQVTDARALRERALVARQRADELLASLTAQYDQAARLSEGAEEPGLAARLDELTAAIDGGTVAESRLAGLRERQAIARDELTGASDERARLAGATAVASAAHDTAAAEHRDLTAELDDARGNYAGVAARQAALRTSAEQWAARAAAARRVAAAMTTHTQVLTRAQRQARARGFVDLSDVVAAVREEAEQDELRRRTAGWQDEADRLATLAKSAIADLAVAAPAGPDTPADTQADRQSDSRAADGSPSGAVSLAAQQAATDRLTATTEALAAAELRSTRAVEVAELARHARDRFAERSDDLSDARALLAEAQQRAEPVTYLAQLAKGMAGARRTTLTSFVLRHWFEQVVQTANVRLAAMSAGRYELIRVDEGATAAQRAGLTVAVLDRYTGEQRGTGSLSGGETFYTSLALALGLADVVRAEAGGVDLDTLFIDEGFGSLDSDTLEEVMSVIDDLRERGRVIGIVSHVSELKDRITERVEVRRRADGSSELRVVA